MIFASMSAKFVVVSKKVIVRTTTTNTDSAITSAITTVVIADSIAATTMYLSPASRRLYVWMLDLETSISEME